MVAEEFLIFVFKHPVRDEWMGTCICRSIKPVIWILDLPQIICWGIAPIIPRERSTRLSNALADLREKTSSSYPPGKRASFQPHQTLHPFTFRKRTAMNAMVKVTITLAYSSVGNFSTAGNKLCEKKERDSVINACSLYQGYTAWWRSQQVSQPASQKGGTGHLLLLIGKSRDIFYLLLFTLLWQRFSGDYLNENSKYDCLIKMKILCIFNACLQAPSKSFCSAICIHKILKRKTRCTFKKHRHEQAVSQEHGVGENIQKNLLLSSNRAVLGIPYRSEKVYSVFTATERNFIRVLSMKTQLSLLITYVTVWRLEAEIGGDLHVRAAESENTQAEVQQLQSQERDLRVSLLQEGNRNSVIATRLWHFYRSSTFYTGPVLCSHWT